MTWEVEFTDEFEEWWAGLTEQEQDGVDRCVRLLEAKGPTLRFPASSDIRGTKYGNMRELRVQVNGSPYRIFYAFDPRRTAMLLIGGNKVGDDDFYERMVPKAESIYEQHLRELRASEGQEEEK